MYTHLRAGAFGAALAALPLPGNVLGEFDFLVSGSEAAPTLYNRTPGKSNGTVGTGATYGATGLATGGTTGFADSGVAQSAARTILVFMTPQAGAGVGAFASQTPSGTTTPQFLDFSGAMPFGQVYPRFRDLGGSAQVNGQVSAASWPLCCVCVQDNPGRVLISGQEPAFYDTQDSLASITRTTTVSFGNNFASSAAYNHVYHYAVIWDTVLTNAQCVQAEAYVRARCKLRGIPLGGPAAFTNPLLVGVGNSLISNSDLSKLLTTVRTYEGVKATFGNTTAAQWDLLATTSALPLFRPLAARNAAFVWPTATLSATSDIANYVAPLCRRLRAAGFKVVVGYPISHSGFDALKNLLWTALDDASTGWATFADARADFRGVPELANDGAFNNATYYLDLTHLTLGNSGTNTGYGKAYPVIAAALDLVA